MRIALRIGKGTFPIPTRRTMCTVEDAVKYVGSPCEALQLGSVLQATFLYGVYVPRLVPNSGHVLRMGHLGAKRNNSTSLLQQLHCDLTKQRKGSDTFEIEQSASCKAGTPTGQAH